MARTRILIVGGVAGGASAATRARRLNEQAEIIIFEKGDYASFANCGLPYYIGEHIKDRAKLLVAKPKDFEEKFAIDLRLRHEVVRIDRSGKQIEVINHATGERTSEPYDQLVLSPGAEPIVPPWEGADAPNVFTLRDVGDTDRIKAFVDQNKPKRAVVIGAGFIGIEMVECLTDRGVKVMVAELQPQIMPLLDPEMAAQMASVLREHQVDLHLGVQVDDLRRDGAPGSGDADRVTAVHFADGQQLPTDMVLISVGVRPMVELAREADLKIGSSGGVAVNGYLQTSDPDIYAIGDAAEVTHIVTGEALRVPLAGPANRNGRLAGQRCATSEAPLATPVAGTAIVGAFGKAAAMTGLSVKEARKAGLACAAVYAIDGHHAGYYPGAERMILKLVFDPTNRRILGAQAVGGAGVDKRIDIIATAIRFKGTIDDLAGVDLTYAPQFGSARDPVHLVAFVAQNQADGLFKQILPGDPMVPGQLLDVRTEPEVVAGTLTDAINIPLQRLRENLDQLDKNKPVTVYCGVGLRGYIAARILEQSGFREVYNLAGGYTLHRDTWAESIAKSTG